jgi:Protein phosphatase inhibitor
LLLSAYLMYTATRNGPSTSAPGDGSRTLTITNNPTQEENGDEQGDDPEGSQIIGTLNLRVTRQTGPRVAWDEHVIDNEGFGKKKSKSNHLHLNIFHRILVHLRSLFQFAVFTINHGDSTSHRMNLLILIRTQVPLVHMNMTIQATITIIVPIALEEALVLQILNNHRGLVE